MLIPINTSSFFNKACLRSTIACEESSSAPSIEFLKALSPPAMIPVKRSLGAEKVGGISEASKTPRRPDVPAPI